MSTFEFPALLLPTNLKQLMHSQSALAEHVSLSLVRFLFCSTLYVFFSSQHVLIYYGNPDMCDIR